MLRTELQLPDGLTREYLEYHGVLPLAVKQGRVVIATAGEPDVQALDDLAIMFRAQPDLLQVPDEQLREAIRAALDANTSLGDLESVEIEPAAPQHLLADARDLAQQPPVVRYVNLLIREAHAAGASDVHVESIRDGLTVRLRLDGVLAEGTAPPRGLEAAVVSRIKLLADLDIAERRVPQDGRIRIRLAESELDVRVSTVPSLHGEGVVLRLLDRAGRPNALIDLGMDHVTLEAFASLARRPHGILLVTGPTGAGKTTTLHAALMLRDVATEKVVAIEDPVEYQLAGVTQIGVNTKAGLQFATALRSVLRQDPDVIMVGEMRDEETASVATRAAMTGHLVLSTLHTRDAIGAIPRLADLGIAPYLVASSVDGVLAQRLVRRICPDCRQRYTPDTQTVALLARRPLGSVRLERGAGCDACRGTGFRGRTGLYELLVLDDGGRDAIATEIGSERMRQALGACRATTLREDGWAKVQAGLTTVEEVLRVTEG